MQTNLVSLTDDPEEVVDHVMDQHFHMHRFEPPYVVRKDIPTAIRKMADGSLQIWEVNGTVTLPDGSRDYNWVREAKRKLHS